MNAFFDVMVPLIEGNEGAIDKFMGDCVMAFWGIPFNNGKAAHAAIGTGCMMFGVLLGLNSRFDVQHKPVLEMGIGCESGPAVVGNIVWATDSSIPCLAIP